MYMNHELITEKSSEEQPERDKIIHEMGKIAVFVAWPYANGPRHIGHAAALMPADVVARYHRASGDEVMMVSGTDEYGTPGQLAAERENVDTQDYVDKINDIIRNDFVDLGMSFDLFTRTTTETHAETVQNFFAKLVDSGYITKDTMMGTFDIESGRNLPDRYVEGECPNCSSEGARGDQCDACTKLLEPSELINPRSSISGNEVEFKETPHYFLRLDLLKDDVSKFLDGEVNLRKDARNFSENIVNDLRQRSITRDIEWGVNLPEGYEIEGEERVLYVWFEAVIGYLSAAIEWAKINGEPDKWREFWTDPSADNYYVMGKDNVPFHTLIWPAMIFGFNKSDKDFKLELPKNILSTGNLNFGEDKFSSSRGNVVYIKDLLKEVGPDALRYYLIAAGPENSDSSFTFEQLVTRTNNELIAKWGNLISRTTNLIARDFDNRVPKLDGLNDKDKDIIEKVKKSYSTVGSLIEEGKFSAALSQVMEVVGIGNKYIYEEKPWDKDVITSGRNKAVLAVLAVIIENSNRLLSPFIPHSSIKISDIFNDESLSTETHMPKLHTGKNKENRYIVGDYGEIRNTWTYSQEWPGTKTKEGKHIIFRKLDEEKLIEAMS